MIVTQHLNTHDNYPGKNKQVEQALFDIGTWIKSNCYLLSELSSLLFEQTHDMIVQKTLKARDTDPYTIIHLGIISSKLQSVNSTCSEYNMYNIWMFPHCNTICNCLRVSEILPSADILFLWSEFVCSKHCQAKNWEEVTKIWCHHHPVCQNI